MRGISLRKEELVIADKFDKLKFLIEKPVPLKEHIYELQSYLQQLRSSSKQPPSPGSGSESSSRDDKLILLVPEVYLPAPLCTSGY